MQPYTSPNTSPNFSSQPEQTLELQKTPAFMAKVFMAFAAAIFISAAGTYTAFRYFSYFFLLHPVAIWGLFILELILVLTSRMWSARHPLNYALFALFAFTSGATLMPLFVGTLMEFGGPAIMIKAFLSTTLAFTAAAVFGWTTKRNLTGIGGFLTLILVGMIVVGLLGLFIPWGNNFEMIFSGIGVGLFSAYTMYDIQRLKAYPEDRYIDAALQLYLDIFNLFIFILRLVSGVSRR